MAKHKKKIVAPSRSFFDEPFAQPTTSDLQSSPAPVEEQATTAVEPLGPDSFGGEDFPMPPEKEAQIRQAVDDVLSKQRPSNGGMAYKESMDNLALVFLDDSIARRLAVAWMTCKGDEANWFEAAGFTPAQYQEARRISRALRLNGVCREGGVTDPLALQYIQAVIAKPLSAKKGK